MMCMLVEIFLQVLDISTNLLNFPLKVYKKDKANKQLKLKQKQKTTSKTIKQYRKLIKYKDKETKRLKIKRSQKND